MCMRMQPFLSVGDALSAEKNLPREVLTDLAAAGYPAIRSFRRVKVSCHETFVLDFAEDVPAFAAVHEGSSRSCGVLQILGAQLGDKPIFSVQSPISADLIVHSLKLAAEAGVLVPHAWHIGVLDRRATLHSLTYVLMEFMESDTIEDQVFPDPGTLNRIIHEQITGRLALRVLSDTEIGPLPRFEDAFAMLAELRSLAIDAGSGELEGPIRQLEAECSSKWALQPIPPSLFHQDLNTGNVLCSRDSSSPAGGWHLSALIDWESAVVGDARLSAGQGEPWEQIRAFAHVVKGRWLASIARTSPSRCPRCQMVEILENHDAGQKLLVERGYLPKTVLTPGSSFAKLAETFPEELCPHYGQHGLTITSFS